MLSVLILATLYLSSCSGLFPAQATIQPGTLLYGTDFATTSDGWLSYMDENGAMDHFGGAYRIIVTTPRFDLWSLAGRQYADVRLDVDAGPLSGPADARYGLICRFIDPQNFYYFVITADGFYSLGRVVQGQNTLLDQDMLAYNAAINTGFAFNHIRFECSGTTLKGIVNDHLLAIVSDDSLASGDVGFLAGTFATPGTDVAFDNFKVYQP